MAQNSERRPKNILIFSENVSQYWVVEAYVDSFLVYFFVSSRALKHTVYLSGNNNVPFLLVNNWVNND